MRRLAGRLLCWRGRHRWGMLRSSSTNMPYLHCYEALQGCRRPGCRATRLLHGAAAEAAYQEWQASITAITPTPDGLRVVARR